MRSEELQYKETGMAGKYIKLPTFAGERGSLTAIEECADAPFNIRRAFFLYDLPADAHRGRHAYRHKELVVCLTGACGVSVDDGRIEESFILNEPTTALYIPENTWRDIHDFVPGTVLAVLSDAPFSDEDYIWDREEFHRERNSELK